MQIAMAIVIIILFSMGAADAAAWKAWFDAWYYALTFGSTVTAQDRSGISTSFDWSLVSVWCSCAWESSGDSGQQDKTTARKISMFLKHVLMREVMLMYGVMV
jgi:hypothetical protein